MREIHELDLSPYNSYRIKAICKKAWFPETEREILNLYEHKKDYFLIGNGYNIIFSKDYYENEFIIFNGNFKKAKIYEDGSLSAEAGCTMLQLSELALHHGFSGLEIFYDIPSSLGGAVVMNAGASGEEIKDVLTRVRYLDLEDMKIKEILKKDIAFEYRNSFFQRNKKKIVLKAWLKLVPGDPSAIKDKMDKIKKQRWAKQPRDLPNAGSVFKRPPGYYVGVIIDQLDLKGYTVGGAKISEKHGGFIVNFNQATGDDLLSIINHVQDKVRTVFGVDLEIEQRIL